MIALSKLSLTEGDISETVEVIRSGQLVQGNKVAEVEKIFEELFPNSMAIAVSNGTAALHLALLAHGIGEGDEVIVPAYSFVATANAVELCGAKAVFADIDLANYNVSGESVSRMITNKTKAILPVHEFGIPAPIEKLNELARTHSLSLIEDAACALGSKSMGNLIGEFATTSCYSFHPRKIVTSGEGGLVLTKKSHISEFVRSMRNHGINPRVTQREYILAGFNYRMSDISASLLVGQIRRLEEITIVRNRIAALYTSGITNQKIKLTLMPAGVRFNWQTFSVLVDSKIGAESLIKYLRSKDIESAKPSQFIPSEPYYLHKYKHSLKTWPNAMAAVERAVALPMHDQLSLDEVERVIEAVNDF